MPHRILIIKNKKAPKKYPEGLNIVKYTEEYVDLLTSADLMSVCHTGIKPEYIIWNLEYFSLSIVALDEDNNIVAFGTLRNIKKENLFYIYLLCSLEPGLGTQILNIVLEIAQLNDIKIIKLDAKNKELVTYYQKFGFKVIAV